VVQKLCVAKKCTPPWSLYRKFTVGRFLLLQCTHERGPIAVVDLAVSMAARRTQVEGIAARRLVAEQAEHLILGGVLLADEEGDELVLADRALALLLLDEADEVLELALLAQVDAELHVDAARLQAVLVEDGDGARRVLEGLPRRGRRQGRVIAV